MPMVYQLWGDIKLEEPLTQAVNDAGNFAFL